MLKLRKRDIRNGDLLYGERLQLVNILRDEERDDTERAQDIIECLHGIRPPKLFERLFVPAAVEYATAMIEWLQREKNECSVEPMPEAVQAGAEQVSKAVGELGNIVSLAERFGWTFQQVYNMPYRDVFAIWKVDAEREKFERRLNKVLQQKRK